MGVPQIQLQTSPGKISILTKRPEQTIRQPRAEQSIEQPKADVTIRQKKGKLTIDQTNAWHNIDLKSSPVRTRELAGMAREDLLSGIARVAGEGDELMRIENGGSPIADQAQRNSGYDFTFTPGGRPVYELVALSYEPGKAEISVTPRKPIIETVPHKPEHIYRKGAVQVEMAHYPELKIDWKV
ncbi:hypothetical protein M662_14700 [Bacillus sp. SB49]|uniref:DUF6470 family protein n=1 Tax=Halobacillus sp. BAB-2008 TaxID=1246484 RepID=UPI0002A4F4C2|nr:DUF6470 family protein [Halobacillus sp. BAB-2008]ELK47062.1 hypothetical protein D479_08026 [Halobacillus sp. BAB-2008]QHT47677.1 hypothetical protein M662_14700 [Bacillus sp. SB49]